MRKELCFKRLLVGNRPLNPLQTPYPTPYFMGFDSLLMTICRRFSRKSTTNLPLHPYDTHDTLWNRVQGQYLSGFWHPCTLKAKISRARARKKVMNLKPETCNRFLQKTLSEYMNERNLEPLTRQRATVCKVEFSKMFAHTSFLNTLTEIRG